MGSTKQDIKKQTFNPKSKYEREFWFLFIKVNESLKDFKEK